MGEGGSCYHSEIRTEIYRQKEMQETDRENKESEVILLCLNGFYSESLTDRM